MDENFTFENPVFEPDIVDEDLNDDAQPSEQQDLVRNNDDIIDTPVYSKSTSKTKQYRDQVKYSKIQSWLKHLGLPRNTINPLYVEDFSIARDQGQNVLKFRKSGGSEIILDDLRSKYGKFRSPRQIMRDLGGPQTLKEITNFEGSSQQLEDIVENTTESIKVDNQKLKKLSEEVPTNLEMNSMSNEDLVESITKINKAVRTISTNTDLDMREFSGIDGTSAYKWGACE